MDEAELPRKSFWLRKKTVALFIAGISVAGFSFCGYIYGFDPILNIWRETKSLAAKTFQDVLGNGKHAELAAEIDLAIPAASSSDAEQDIPTVNIFEDTDDASAAEINLGDQIVSPPPAEKLFFTSASDTPAVSGTATNNFISPTCNFLFASEAFSSARSGDEPTHKILFNEIAWAGSIPENGEASAQAGNREWIELRNNNGASVDLSGWQVINQSEKLKITFDADARINFGELLLLERGDDNAAPGIAADKIYSGALSNSGEWLRLFDGNCVLIDEIDASRGWPGGSNSTKATLERDLMDPDWHTSGFPGGTPKAANTVVWKANVSQPQPAPPPPQVFIPSGPADGQDLAIISSSVAATSTGVYEAPPTHLVIAAVQIAGAASNNDVMKIFNPTASAVDVSGWRLRKRTSSGSEYSIRVLPAGSTVQAQNYFVWANSANGFASSIGADASSSETLAADNSVALEDASGTIVDALAWGSDLTNPFVEGASYPTNPSANQILSRKFTNGVIQDADDNAQDFEIN